MNPGHYPRPSSSKPSPAQPYDGDRTWGGVIILFSALRLFSDASSLAVPTTQGHRVLTMITMGLLAIRLVGGIGLLTGRRWGLVLVAIVSSVYVLIGLLNLAAGGSALALVSLAISAYVVYYCVKRLTGREGPPVA